MRERLSCFCRFPERTVPLQTLRVATFSPGPGAEKHDLFGLLVLWLAIPVSRNRQIDDFGGPRTFMETMCAVVWRGPSNNQWKTSCVSTIFTCVFVPRKMCGSSLLGLRLADRILDFVLLTLELCRILEGGLPLCKYAIVQLCKLFPNYVRTRIHLLVGAYRRLRSRPSWWRLVFTQPKRTYQRTMTKSMNLTTSFN